MTSSACFFLLSTSNNLCWITLPSAFNVRSFSLGYPVLVRKPSNFVPTLRPKLLNTSTKHLTRFSLDSEEYDSSEEEEKERKSTVRKTKTPKLKNNNNDTNNYLLTKMVNDKTNNKPFSLKNLSAKSKIQKKSLFYEPKRPEKNENNIIMYKNFSSDESF